MGRNKLVFIRTAIRQLGTLSRRQATQTRAHVFSIRRARGQSVVEFSLIAVVLFPLLFALIIFMFNLAQSWSIDQAVENLGQSIITTGEFSEDAEGDFRDDSNKLGFPADPIPALTVTVTHCDPDLLGCTTEDFLWTEAADLRVQYGDLVSIKVTKSLGGLVEILPNTKVSWSGIAQRNSP